MAPARPKAPSLAATLRRVWFPLTVSLCVVGAVGAGLTYFFHSTTQSNASSAAQHGFLSVFTSDLNSFDEFMQVTHAQCCSY